MEKFNVLIIGFGEIGKERLNSLSDIAQYEKYLDIAFRVFIYDVNFNDSFKTKEFENLQIEFLSNIKDIEYTHFHLVIIATPHNIAKSFIELALPYSNVLIEKPMGISLNEAREIEDQQKKSQKKLFVGFNYRFYYGIQAIIDDAKNGVFGKLISVDMHLAHGNSPGMENSWKLNKDSCGGGWIIDPGIHLLDLSNILSENLELVGLNSWNGFWKTGIEESVNINLKAKEGFIVNLSGSLVSWRSRFRIEIIGEDGYGYCQGRGRSYGIQSYRRGKRWGWMNGSNQEESEQIIVEGCDGSESFTNELHSILEEIIFDNSEVTSTYKLNPCNMKEGLRGMVLLDKIYSKLYEKY